MLTLKTTGFAAINAMGILKLMTEEFIASRAHPPNRHHAFNRVKIMNIKELSKMIGGNIEISYSHRHGIDTWICYLDRTSTAVPEISETARKMESGTGKTPNEALIDYVKKIKGKRLFIYSDCGNKEVGSITVPDDLKA